MTNADEEFIKQWDVIIGTQDLIPEETLNCGFISDVWVFENDCVEERKEAIEYLRLKKKQIVYRDKLIYDFLNCCIIYKPVWGHLPACLILKLYVRTKTYEDK